MSRINDLILSLNNKISPQLSKDRIEKLLNKELGAFLDATKSTDLEKTYRQLSRKLHPDNILVSNLKDRGLNNLPQQILNELYEQKKDNTYWIIKYSNYINNKIPIINFLLLEFSELIQSQANDINDCTSDEMRNALEIEHEKERNYFIQKAMCVFWAEFPELYDYENYPKPLSNIIFILYTMINFAICAILSLDYFLLQIKSFLIDVIILLLKFNSINTNLENAESALPLVEYLPDSVSLFSLLDKASYNLFNEIKYANVKSIGNLILPGIALIISVPLIFISNAIEIINSVSPFILMAVKLLSAELVNAPLKAYSYFATSTTSTEEQANTSDCLAIVVKK